MNYNAKYVVRLTEEERDELQGIVRRGKVAAAKRTRAQGLLKAAAGLEGSGAEGGGGGGPPRGRGGVPPAPRRAGAVDFAIVERQVGRARSRRVDQPRVRAADVKKNEIKPWLKQHWVLPKPDDPDFVCAMEDVLDVYQRPQDPLRPLVTLDEASKQLVADGTPPGPLPA